MKSRFLLLLLPAVLAAAPGDTGHAEDALNNPFTGDSDVEAGGRLYRSHCAVCHGIEGEGGRGAALTTGMFRHGGTDRDLYTTISEGIPGTEMPGIFFNGKQLWQIVSYVRSLSEGRGADMTQGDPDKGQAVYAANGCNACHRIRGDGGRMGPDLSDIGAMRSLGHLQSAVLRPDEAVFPQHWMVRAKTDDGEAISGMRMNEDTFSVQLLDASGQLLSLQKSDLAEFEVDRSSGMPSFEGKIQGDDLDNLVAFLASQRLRRASNADQ